MPATRESKVIVTRREIERLFVEQPAESAIHAAAGEQSPMEQAQAMAMTGAILRELQKAEQATGSERVMVTAQHGPASRLQSLIAAGELGTLTLAPLPAGGLEAKFDTRDWVGWSTVVWAKLKHLPKHAMLRPSHPGVLPMRVPCPRRRPIQTNGMPSGTTRSASSCRSRSRVSSTARINP